MDWTTPYPSARSPLFARNIVATSQPLAAQAGLRAMQEGGNAVDAALAAAIALTVVEPNMNGIGSDAFAIVWDGTSLHGMNASGRSPKAWSPERFAGYDAMPRFGWDAVTVPGAVSAWVALSDRFGELSFEHLFDAAIHYAEDGFQLGPRTGYYWKLAERTFGELESELRRLMPGGIEAFFRTFMPAGKAPDIGSLVRLPDHADTLREIAATHGESFYRGRLAETIAAAATADGGALSQDDLAVHRCDWVETISTRYREVDLHEIPPNGQGIMALIALGIAERCGFERLPLDSADSFHAQIECMRLAYADIERHLADIDHMRVTPQRLLDPAYLDARASQIDMQRANPHPTALGASEDTVYLTTADERGMMVSMIQSNYRGFGSGIVVPGTGISLQNRGNGFTLEKGHPNQVAGGKRPYHTIIPGFVTREGKPQMSFGVMGGHMQAQGHFQMMLRIFSYAQNPQAASDAPRWLLMENGIVAVERGFDAAIVNELRKRGHSITDHTDDVFGGAQLIYKLQDGYCAGSDHRKEGLAIGF